MNKTTDQTQTRRTVTVSVTVDYDPTALNRSDVLRAVRNATDGLSVVSVEGGVAPYLTVKEVELS